MYLFQPLRHGDIGPQYWPYQKVNLQLIDSYNYAIYVRLRHHKRQYTVIYGRYNDVFGN